MTDKTKIKFLCRSVAGVIFIVSAILKFLSLDSFELFIYGLDWFSLGTSSFLVRALLFTEMTLGVCLVTGLYGKFASRLSALLLLFFTVYLIYLTVSGKSDNCHCFGDLIEMDPLESMIKNVILGILLYLGWNLDDWQSHWKPALLITTIVGSLVFALVLKAPYGFNRKATTYSEEELNQLATQHPEITEKGKQILAFVSKNCKHCKMATRKLDIALHHAEPEDVYMHWFVLGDSTHFQNFLTETGAKPDQYDFLPAKVFLKITQGKLPLILLLEDGEVKEVMSNATFNEKNIIKFAKEQL